MHAASDIELVHTKFLRFILGVKKSTNLSALYGELDINIPFDLIRQRILDMYKQTWDSEINNSNRLQAYSIFKHNFELESYLI